MSKSQTLPGPARPARRGFMLGAAVAGAAGAAAVVLKSDPAPVEAALPEAPQPPERGGGYRLSDHVKHYYKTTLV
jgi:hypothetical protein